MNKNYNNQNTVNGQSYSEKFNHQQGYYNMEKAFQPSEPAILRPSFKNDGKLIHNNIGDKILSEHVIEYNLNINSNDRNKTQNPSMFSFETNFGDNSTCSIAQKFERVKYITIDSIILPRTVAIDTSHVTDTPVALYPTDSTYTTGTETAPNVLCTLSKRRYLILTIKELNSDMYKSMGTSSLIDKNSIIIGHDYDLGIDNALWKPIHTNRIVYKNSKTGNLNKLTFTITYEDGSKINLIDQDSNNIIGKNITGISQDYIAFVDSNSSVESVAYTDGVTQVLYNITVGIIEAEMNIDTQYVKS